MRETILTFAPIQKKNNCFFDIEETPVLYQDPLDSRNYRRYPDKKIILNKSLNEGISIVANSFLPVRHEEAFNLGVNIFEMLFGVTPQIHKQKINANSTDYNVDFISEKCKIVFDTTGFRFVGENGHKGISTEIGNRSTLNLPTGSTNYIVEKFYDEYYPFIRVSNYLREGNSFFIELGYYRYRCSNGMMLGRKTKMTFKHSYRVGSFRQIKESAIEQFLRYKERFMDMAAKLWRLLSIHVPKAQMRLVSFDIFEKELIKKSIAERKRLQAMLSDLIDKYVLEIGENLNAAINVATEFSKLLEGTRVSQSTIQNLTTIWISRAAKKTFNIDTYLKEIINIEEKVLNAKEVEEEEEEFEY